jgi:hypothetical protein
VACALNDEEHETALALLRKAATHVFRQQHAGKHEQDRKDAEALLPELERFLATGEPKRKGPGARPGRVVPIRDVPLCPVSELQRRLDLIAHARVGETPPVGRRVVLGRCRDKALDPLVTVPVTLR